MGFESVANRVADEPFLQVGRGDRDGRGREIYFRDPIWLQLKRRCEARGISVSRYLQTLAVMSLEEDER